MTFDMSVMFVFASDNFKFRWEFIPYFNTLVKNGIIRNI